ncbi:hypothetical protein OROMI_014838 [Orobanche minor]
MPPSSLEYKQSQPWPMFYPIYPWSISRPLFSNKAMYPIVVLEPAVLMAESGSPSHVYDPDLDSDMPWGGWVPDTVDLEGRFRDYNVVETENCSPKEDLINAAEKDTRVLKALGVYCLMDKVSLIFPVATLPLE